MAISPGCFIVSCCSCAVQARRAVRLRPIKFRPNSVRRGVRAAESMPGARMPWQG